VPTLIRTSFSEEYTEALGLAIAVLLCPGDVIALSGELGSGKTTLVRAIAAGLKVDPRLVASPTFVVVNQYPVPSGAGSLSGGQLIHVDAYRLTAPEDLEPLGWDRLFDPITRSAAARAVAVVEWPERIAEALPPEPDLAQIQMTAVSEHERELRLILPDAWKSRRGLDLFMEREPITCPVTGRWVSPTSPTYPFADARARDADMYKWFTGGYKTSRELGPVEDEGQ
jgi:tRNA threonylcarbamoyladenosine biosynthesis protein TsaE